MFIEWGPQTNVARRLGLGQIYLKELGDCTSKIQDHHSRVIFAPLHSCCEPFLLHTICHIISEIAV
jgi:hypothetical protein